MDVLHDPKQIKRKLFQKFKAVMIRHKSFFRKNLFPLN